jgi:hypothetical protein
MNDQDVVSDLEIEAAWEAHRQSDLVLKALKRSYQDLEDWKRVVYPKVEAFTRVHSILHRSAPDKEILGAIRAAVDDAKNRSLAVESEIKKAKERR